jgi:hypothetical protein
MRAELKVRFPVDDTALSLLHHKAFSPGRPEADASQRLGIGRDLVHAVTAEAFKAGCDWVHVDYEPGLADFYENSCGFRPTAAGLRSADDASSTPSGSQRRDDSDRD